MKEHTKSKGIQKSWQTDEYSKHQHLKLTIPQTFLFVCKILNTTPKQLIIDFMDNLSCGSWKREGRDKAKEILLNYFVEHRYGQELYSPEEIQQMFKELDAIGMLFPRNADAELQDLHVKWREHYQGFWFNKWFNKNCRVL